MFIENQDNLAICKTQFNRDRLIIWRKLLIKLTLTLTHSSSVNCYAILVSFH